jgi:hypothetical protein
MDKPTLRVEVIGGRKGKEIVKEKAADPERADRFA